MRRLVISCILLIITQPTLAAEKVTIKLDSGSLALRDEAKPNSKSCAKVQSGEEFEKIGESNGWFQIKVDKPGCNGNAWIYGYFTEKYYKGSKKMSELQKNWAPTKEHEVTSSIVTPAESIIIGSNIVDETNTPSDAVKVETQTPEVISADTTPSPVSELADGTSIPTPTARPKDHEKTPDHLSLNASKLSAADFEICKFKMAGRNDLDPTRTKNCWELMKKANRGEIPKDALVYSLKYLKANLGQLRDSSCIGSGAPKGIKNSCQFLMNDMNKRIKGFPHRSPSYFIDLCHAGAGTSGKGLVYKTYANRGTGSVKDKYTDTPKRKTTVIGAFLTGDISPFIPYRISSQYKAIGWNKCFKRNNKGQFLRDKHGNYIPVDNVRKNCPVLRLGLYGAQSSNNTSEASKPMHTSPYKSSIGCPSVGQKDNWMMLELEKRGPSLVMNYGPQKNHKDSSINQCKND